MASSPGKAFLLKRKKDEFVENEMDRLCKNFGQDYYNVLENLSESAILNNLLPKEYTGREESMILNVAYLVRKDKLEQFINTIEGLKERDRNSGFFVDLSGPWPPFSFVSIKELE